MHLLEASKPRASFTKLSHKKSTEAGLQVVIHKFSNV